MKTFIITETRPAYATWTYEVQAETEAEAIDIIENGDAECVDFDNDVDYESEAEYSVEEA